MSSPRNEVAWAWCLICHEAHPEGLHRDLADNQWPPLCEDCGKAEPYCECDEPGYGRNEKP